jgi:hypothetical protein
MRSRGAGQYRANESRCKRRERAHRAQRDAALRTQRRVVRVSREQPLVFDQRAFHFGIARQHAFLGDAETLRGLALRSAEILDAVFGHDAGGFLRDGPAQVVAAR